MAEKNHKKKGGQPPDRSKKTISEQKALEEANTVLQKENERLKGEPKEIVTGG